MFEAFDFGEDEDFGLAFGQFGKRFGEFLVEFCVLERAAWRILTERPLDLPGQRQGFRIAFGGLNGFSDGYAVEVWLPFSSAVILVPSAPYFEEDFLMDVLSLLGVAQDSDGGVEHLRAVLLNQFCKVPY